MSAETFFAILKNPFQPPYGVFMALIGLYSLFFNVRDAARKNHRRSMLVAKIGGWLYLLAGLLIAFKIVN